MHSFGSGAIQHRHLTFSRVTPSSRLILEVSPTTRRAVFFLLVLCYLLDHHGQSITTTQPRPTSQRKALPHCQSFHRSQIHSLTSTSSSSQPVMATIHDLPNEVLLRILEHEFRARYNHDKKNAHTMHNVHNVPAKFVDNTAKVSSLWCRLSFYAVLIVKREAIKQLYALIAQQLELDGVLKSEMERSQQFQSRLGGKRSGKRSIGRRSRISQETLGSSRRA